MKKTIFISRDLNSDSPLQKALEVNNFAVHAKALIETKGIAFPLPLPAADWIFFSSQNAVYYFFERVKNINGRSVAAIGRATAAALKPFTPCHFTGSGNNTSDIAASFARVATDGIILFPQSDRSLKTVEKLFEPSRCIPLICYETIDRPSVIPPCEYLIFTSPSNVQAYCLLNIPLHHQIAIGLGEKTCDALSKSGFMDIRLADSLQPKDVLLAINAAKHS